jgi:hypothetical protein
MWSCVHLSVCLAVDQAWASTHEDILKFRPRLTKPSYPLQRINASIVWWTAEVVSRRSAFPDLCIAYPSGPAIDQRERRRASARTVTTTIVVMMNRTVVSAASEA